MIDKEELKKLFKISSQAVFSQLALMSMTMIDIIMAGRYSEQLISAISLGTNILHPSMVIMYGLFCAVNPLAAQFNGKCEKNKLTQLVLTGVILALLIAPFYILIIRNTEFVSEALNINAEILPMVHSYLDALTYGFPFFLMFLCLRFFCDGIFKSKYVLITSLIVAPINALLNWIFLYGKFGFTELGAAGLAYSTVISWVLLAVILLALTLRNPDLQFTVKENLTPNKDILVSMFKIGMPIAGSISLELILLASVGLIAGQYAVNTVAAHQIAMSLCFIFLMIPLGIATATTARTGFYHSQENALKVLNVKKLSLGMTTIMSFVSMAIMIFAGALFVSIYSQDDATCAEAYRLLMLAALIQLPAGLIYTLNGYLRGLKDTLNALYVSAIVYWGIGFPVAYYLSSSKNYGVSGLWLGLLVSYILGTVSLFYLASRHYRLDKTTDKTQYYT